MNQRIIDERTGKKIYFYRIDDFEESIKIGSFNKYSEEEFTKLYNQIKSESKCYFNIMSLVEILVANYGFFYLYAEAILDIR